MTANTDIDKRAPVQGYSAGIPWSMHLRAYDAYCKKYGPQPALIEGWCRGGFGVSELDMFVPGWRDEVSEITALRTALRTAQEERDKAIALHKNEGDAVSIAVREVERLHKENARMREALIPFAGAKKIALDIFKGNSVSLAILNRVACHYIDWTNFVRAADALPSPPETSKSK